MIADKPVEGSGTGNNRPAKAPLFPPPAVEAAELASIAEVAGEGARADVESAD